MSIPLLSQVHGEIRRLSIAGSAVAGGDFRLKKLVPALEQAGKQAPVFAKVAQSVDKLLASDERSSAETLLEVSTLVNAVLYTQGETDAPGDLEPIESVDLGTRQTRNSARVLKPLLEALTTTGSGRVETVKDACDRGLFLDLRLVGPALSAIDDPYPEIAELIAERVLPLYGRTIAGELREKLDLGGRAGHVRRLQLLHRLDPQAARELVKRALEEGSKEMKVAAIACLGDDPEDLGFLLTQTKARAAEVRSAALKALSKSTSGDAVAAIRAAFLGGDSELAVEPVRNSKSPQVLAFVLDEARAQWAALFKEKDKAKAGKIVERVLMILECLRGRDDKATGELLTEWFAGRAKLSAIKGDPGGKDVERRLIGVMATGPAAAQAAIVDAHSELDADALAAAFAAAIRSRKPDEVFKLFSPYLTAKVDSKKKNDPALLKRDVVAGVIGDRYGHSLADFRYAGDGKPWQPSDFDPRWLDAAVMAKHVDVVQTLARSGHAPAEKFLEAEFDSRLAAGKDPYDVSQLLGTMVRIEHPSAVRTVAAAIEKFAEGSRAYGLSWIMRLIPDLPKSALPVFEALQSKLPDKAVDELIDAVDDLKRRP
jgi:hypothetical protein